MPFKEITSGVVLIMPTFEECMAMGMDEDEYRLSTDRRYRHLSYDNIFGDVDWTAHPDAVIEEDDDEMFLTEEELKELTGYSTKSKQVKALELMQVPHFVRPDGKPRVAAAVLTGGAANDDQEPEINQDAI